MMSLFSFFAYESPKRRKKMRRSRFFLALSFAVVMPLALSAATWSEPSPNSEQVVFFSGGTIDDGLTFILLTTMDEANLQGVVVTNADCIADLAMELQWKISSYTQSTEIPVSLSDARGWNPFPWSYRADCIRFSNVEALKSYGANPQWPPYPSGDELIEELLTRAIANDTPLTMLVTCPVTALSNVLAKNPKLAQGIERMIFMGGAIDVPGNLDPETIPKEIASSGGEWNIFWDPVSTEWIFNNTSFPIILFPLDVTNQAKLAPLMPRLREKSLEFAYSKLAYEGYELTGDEPYYCMWNVVTSCYIPHPEFFGEPVRMNLEVVTEGNEQGDVVRKSSGREVEVILSLKEPDQYYDYVLKQLAQ